MISKSIDQIIVTGSIAYDEIMDFPGTFIEHFHPEKLHQINVSFVVNKLEKQLGGTATNIAYNLSLVTKKTIKLVGGVGKDGNDFLDFFTKNNIDIDGIFVDTDIYTAAGKVITDIKDNQIWGFYYGACQQAINIDLKKIIAKNSFLILTPTHANPFIFHQKTAIDLKVDYMYDPGMALTWISSKDLKEGILNARFLIGNDYEIAQIFKKSGLKIEDLIKKGIGILTTLGEKGVKYIDKNHKLTISAFKVTNVIDPTGAGDSFRAGFISGFADGLNIKNSLKLGNALASFAIEKYGTVNHKPTKAEIEKRINNL